MICWASQSRGPLSSTAPNFTASLGMPYTMQLASSWANVRARARIAHQFEAAGAVVAHARHDDAQRIAAGALCHRAEQDVHGWPVAIDQGAIADLDAVMRGLAPQQQVASAWRNQCQARAHAVA